MNVKEISVDGVVLPNVPLSNIQLVEAVKKLRIPNFRGVFLRDALPKKPRAIECGILNFDDSNGVGTHWVAWYRNSQSLYFDSYGLPPPTELVNYLKCPVYYNSERIQPDNEVFCGHLCLYVLKKLRDGLGFQEVINSLF
jgi:hypothetical protein